jgi:transcriptional regulator with XRE-family HTH domain
MNTTPAHIAAQVRRARKSQGLSQEKLAELAGVAPGTISALEQGKKVRPGNLHAIRTTLGLPDGNDEPAPDDERAQKIALAHDMLDKWIGALPPEGIDAAINDFARWVVSRL